MRDTKSLSERTRQKHAAIKEEYKKLFDEGFRNEVIYPKLAEKYYMSESSIEALIWERGGYHQSKEKKKEGNQLNLFDDAAAKKL